MGTRKKKTSRFKKVHACERWKWKKKKMRRRRRKKKYLKQRLK